MSLTHSQSPAAIAESQICFWQTAETMQQTPCRIHNQIKRLVTIRKIINKTAATGLLSRQATWYWSS